MSPKDESGVHVYGANAAGNPRKHVTVFSAQLRQPQSPRRFIGDHRNSWFAYVLAAFCRRDLAGWPFFGGVLAICMGVIGILRTR
jgi:hypothetical protein